MSGLEKSLETFLKGIIDIFPQIIFALIIFIFFYIFARLIRSIAQKTLAKTSTEGHVDFIVAKLVYISLLSIGAVISLSIAGVNLTALAAGLGLAGFAFGFALKDVISNFLSGIIILFQRPFTVGDQIIIEGVEGTVEDIRVRDSIIKTYDGRMVFIPNNTVFNNIIINNTIGHTRRVDIIVGVSYESDLGKVINISKKIMDGAEMVEEEPSPIVLVREFSESAISIELRCWTDTDNFSFLKVSSELTRRVKEEFNKNDIKIPFPIRTVHIRKE